MAHDTPIPLKHFASTMAADAQAQRKALQRDLNAIDSGLLPLAQAMQHGSMPVSGSHRALVHAVQSDGQRITARGMLLFHSVEAGCACENDPTPMNELQEQADFVITLDPDHKVVMLSLCI